MTRPSGIFFDPPALRSDQGAHDLPRPRSITDRWQTCRSHLPHPTDAYRTRCGISIGPNRQRSWSLAITDRANVDCRRCLRLSR